MNGDSAARWVKRAGDVIPNLGEPNFAGHAVVGHDDELWTWIRHVSSSTCYITVGHIVSIGIS